MDYFCSLNKIKNIYIKKLLGGNIKMILVFLR